MTDLSQRLPDGNPLLPLEAICDLHEILMVRAETERRAHRAAQAKERRPGRGGRGKR